MATFTVTVERDRNYWVVRYKTQGQNKRTHRRVRKDESGYDETGKLLTGKNFANEVARKLTIALNTQEIGGSFNDDPIMPHIEKFLDEREARGLSPRTMSGDRINLQQFVLETRIKTIRELVPEFVQKWLVQMRRNGYAAWTIDGRLADLRTFCHWLKDRGHIKETPFVSGIMPKRKESEPRYYTAQEYKALNDAFIAMQAKTDWNDTKRKIDYARLACAIFHSAGLRDAELVGHAGDGANGPRVQWEDITWLPNGKAELLIRKELNKSNRSRVVPLDQGVIERLGSRSTGALVPLTRDSCFHYFARARELAGLETRDESQPSLTIHGLRHTFAKNYLQKGEGNLASLSKLMGHKDIRSTMVYAQFEKAYLHEGIDRAYQRRLVDEQIAGQNVVAMSVAG